MVAQALIETSAAPATLDAPPVGDAVVAFHHGHHKRHIDCEEAKLQRHSGPLTIEDVAVDADDERIGGHHHLVAAVERKEENAAEELEMILHAALHVPTVVHAVDYCLVPVDLVDPAVVEKSLVLVGRLPIVLPACIDYALPPDLRGCA